MNVEQLLAEMARREEAQVNPLRTGVRTSELGELFQLSRWTLSSLFEPALIVRGRENIYSRAGIVEALSDWNDRQVPFPVEPLFNESEAAEFLADLGLPRTVSTFQKWRCRGEGPAYLKIGDTVVRYARKDLEEFAQCIA